MAHVAVHNELPRAVSMAKRDIGSTQTVEGDMANPSAGKNGFFDVKPRLTYIR